MEKGENIWRMERAWLHSLAGANLEKNYRGAQLLLRVNDICTRIKNLPIMSRLTSHSITNSTKQRTHHMLTNKNNQVLDE